MSAKFKQVIYAGQKLVDESGGGGGTYQERSVTPSEQAQTVEAQDGYDALSKVYVDAISSNYVGSGVARKSSSDIALSGATLTAPAGFYESDATKTLDEQAAQTIHPSTSDQTIASGKYLTGAQTIKAVTTNITADKIVSGFTVEIGDADDSDCVASVTGTASGGGGSADLVSLVEGTFSGAFSNSDITKIRARGLGSNPSMTSVSLPNCTSVNDRPFDADSNLENISLPALITAGGYFFSGLNKLTGNYIFPALTQVGTAFAENAKVGMLIFPSLTSMGNGLLSGCTTVTAVDFGPDLATITNNSFRNTTALSTIVLRRTSVVSLPYTSTFDLSRFANGGAGGTIYIPKTLYDALGTGTNDYKAASNWSTINGYGTITWAAIEGSYYETHYADGTTIPTT